MLGGCSIFTSLDGLQDGSSDGGESGDATAGDAQVLADGRVLGDGATDGAISDGSTSDESGTSSLFVNGSFEEGAGGCGIGWAPNYGCTIQRSSIAHSGSYSCEVCTTNNGNDSFAISPIAPANVAPGSYYGEVWLHDDHDADIGSAGLQVFSSLPDGGSDYFQAQIITPGPTWAVSSETFVVEASGQMTLQIHNYEPNGCILVDDVSVYAQ